MHRDAVTSDIYDKPTRKKELVELLKKQLDFHESASDALDSKAMELLKFTSALLGLFSVFQTSLARGRSDVVLVLLGFYVLQAVLVMLAVRPRQWRAIPGSPQGEISYEVLMQDYVSLDDSRYFDQLIADYAGAGGKIGAIQLAQRHNQAKGRRIFVAAVLLCLIIILAVVSVIDSFVQAQ